MARRGRADRIAFGIVASYLKQAIVIQTASPGPPGNKNPAVGSQLDLTFLFAYGLTDRLELDLPLPVTVYKDGAGDEPHRGRQQRRPHDGISGHAVRLHVLDRPPAQEAPVAA